MRKLFTAAQTIRECKGTFVQVKHLDVFDEDLESQGRFELNPPGKITWVYLKPIQYVLSMDGNVLIHKQGREHQTRSLANDSVTREIYQQMMDFLTGQCDKLSQSYQLSMILNSQQKVQLIPKNKSMKTFITRIILTFSKKGGHVASIRFDEPGGDWTRIVFSNVTNSTTP